MMNTRLLRIIEHEQSLMPVISKPKINNVIIDDKCPIFNYVNSLTADSSKKTAVRCLQAIALHLGKSGFYDIVWSNFHAHHLNILISNLVDKSLSPKTISLYVSVIKGISEHAYLLGLKTRLELDAILKVKGSTGSRIKKHKVINRNEFDDLIKRIISSCSNNPVKKVRDIALFHLLVGTGLRRNELANINMSSIDATRDGNGTISINSQFIKVIGKGNKERNIPLHPKTKSYLENWLELRGLTPGPIFFKINKVGHFSKSAQVGLSGSAIYELCKTYNTVAPHSLRRSYATWLDSSGVKLSRISKNLGHAKEATTAVYIIDDESKAYEDVVNGLF